jgi:peptidoglycan hydrolase CwlO-like protein
MLKMMSDMSDRMVGEVTNMVGEINGKVSDLNQTVNSHSQSIAKLEAQVGQIANTLNRREEGKLPS